MRHVTASLAILALMVPVAQAEVYSVIAEGQVIFNGIGDPPLGAVGFGDQVTMSFDVDSNNFVDGIPGDTRGYVIDQSSFSLAFDTPVSVGLLDPFPPGDTPYFTLVDGFPVSDGFFVSTSPISPGGVPLEQVALQANFDVGYTGDTLSSLNIEDAVGVYEFAGLTRFSFTLWEIFPDNVAMEMDFVRLTIIPEPTTLALFAPLALLIARRRR